MENSHLNNPKRIHEKPKHTFMLGGYEYIIENHFILDPTIIDNLANGTRFKNNFAMIHFSDHEIVNKGLYKDINTKML